MNWSAGQTEAEKTRENRLRRVALRQGLQLSKNRRRDPRASDYGHWYLKREGVEVLETADLAEVARYLNEPYER